MGGLEARVPGREHDLFFSDAQSCHFILGHCVFGRSRGSGRHDSCTRQARHARAGGHLEVVGCPAQTLLAAIAADGRAVRERRRSSSGEAVGSACSTAFAAGEAVGGRVVELAEVGAGLGAGAVGQLGLPGPGEGGGG